MNLDLAPEDREFQQEVREFFANSIPEDWKKTVRAGLRLSPENLVAYQRRLAERGWARRPGPRNMAAPAGPRSNCISSGPKLRRPTHLRNSISVSN